MKIVQLAAVLLVLAVEGNAYAIEEKTVQYLPMNTGVEIIFNADGSDWVKMQAFGEADLPIGDRTDVRLATDKAILRAKADLSKFMGERISTNETSEEIVKLLQTATNDGKKIDKESTRKIVDTTIQKIVNQSEAILKGVLPLEAETNMEKKYVRVTIGVSRTSIAVADSLRKEMEGNTSKGRPQGATTPSEEESVKRRSNNFNNY